MIALFTSMFLKLSFNIINRSIKMFEIFGWLLTYYRWTQRWKAVEACHSWSPLTLLLLRTNWNTRIYTIGLNYFLQFPDIKKIHIRHGNDTEPILPMPHNRYLELFEHKMVEFIEREGSSVEAFYEDSKRISASKEEKDTGNRYSRRCHTSVCVYTYWC